MLREKIYEHFKKQDSDKKVSNEITFAPSYFSDCKRKIYFKKTGEEISNPIDEASYFKMALGSAGHDKIQSIVKELGILQECEDLKEIEWQDLKWYYRLDSILNIDNKKYILEIKTVYANGFRSIENEPKKDHLIQACLYMLFEKIDDLIILYVGRDNGFMIEYVYNINDKIIQDTITDINYMIGGLIKLKTNIENKSVPDRDCQIVLKNMGDRISEDFTKDKVKYKTDWRCNYCGYKDKCWKEVINKISDHKFYIDNKFID